MTISEDIKRASLAPGRDEALRLRLLEVSDLPTLRGAINDRMQIEFEVDLRPYGGQSQYSKKQVVDYRIRTLVEDGLIEEIPMPVPVDLSRSLLWRTELGAGYLTHARPPSTNGHLPLAFAPRIEDSIRAMILHIGDNPNREDLRETPGRVVKAWAEIFSGYQDKSDPLKWFKSSAEEMVIERQIDFWSTCEHHMLPFWGTADVAYIPNGYVLGVSKMARLVVQKSRRLQIQENMTHEICQALSIDKTLGAAVSVRARHACMMSRGVSQSHSWLETHAISGKFKDDASTRAEFMQGVRRDGCI